LVRQIAIGGVYIVGGVEDVAPYGTHHSRI